MLKSLFEASIDKLNIPSEMKTAIKEINRICLEAEGNDTAEAQPADAQENTDVDNANGEEEIWKVLSAIQKKAVQNKGNAEGEKWRQKLDEEYSKAVNQHGFKRVKGFEMTINNPDFKKGQTETNAAKNTAEAQPAQAAGAADNSNIPNVKQGSAKLRTEVLAKILKDKGNDDPLIDPIKDVVKLINNPETLKEGSAKLRTAVLPQLIKYYGNDDPIIQTVIDIVKVINTPDAKPQGAGQSKADVNTVQYYLQSTLPNSNVVADGIMGPKTITAIQQKAGLKTTGKMDAETQKAFNQLLSEAKEKVKGMQEKLGVKVDGLIGQQTLAAMNKANLHADSIFTNNPTTPKEYKQSGNTQVAGKQGGKTQGGNTKVAGKQGGNAQGAAKQPEQNAAQAKSNEPDSGITSRPFNEEEANTLLKEKAMTQEQYDIWKKYNIAPIFQKRKADEVRAYIAKVDKAGQQKGGQQQVAQQQGGQQKAGQQKVALKGNGPQTPDEKKFFDQTKENFIKVYSGDNKTDERVVVEKADEAARKALLKYRAGTWAKGGQQNNQQQNA